MVICDDITMFGCCNNKIQKIITCNHRVICVRHPLQVYKVLFVWALGLYSAKLETMTHMILTFVVSLVVSGLLVSSARVSEADANHDATLLNEVKSLLCPESGPSFLRDSAATINATCVINQCAKPTAGCIVDRGCREAIGCEQKCMEKWDSDTTPRKLTVQNCTNKCAFTYQTDAYVAFMTCITDNKCLVLDPIPDMCKSSVKPLKQLSTADLKGNWWVLKGYHPVYDCYPNKCLQFSSMAQQAGSMDYKTTYQTYLVNDSLTQVSAETTVPSSSPGSPISFVINSLGESLGMKWWLIDQADDKSYILVYYCGSRLQWGYEGAMVLSMKQTLSDADYTKIGASYMSAVGLKMADFCTVAATSSCPA
jgi:hypothetical protein